MSLSCDCGTGYDPDFHSYAYNPPDKLKPMEWKQRRSRCQSCAGFINTGEECAKYTRFRSPLNDIEERIHGDEVRLSTWYECEECFDLREALEELGYCVELGDYMKDLIAEYNDLRKGEAA